jgi:hypothetical protein
MTSDKPIAASSFCVVEGCSDPETRPRWVMTDPETKREVLVCSKHAEVELDINSLDLGEWGE